MENKKIYSMLGLAMRAGRLSNGDFICEKDIKSGKSFLIIVADDSSENTKDKFKSMCEFYNVDMVNLGTKELLGKCIGKEYRAIVSVRDDKFAEQILKLHFENIEKKAGGEEFDKTK